MPTTASATILVAVTSAVTHSPARQIIRAGERYAADGPEASAFPASHFLPDGSTPAQLAEARQAIARAKAAAQPNKPPPAPPKARATRATTAVALGRFRAAESGQTVTKGQTFPADDPIVVAHPDKFGYGFGAAD